ncbi:hypothetical protein VNO77_44752 [Canavalia gladiata]|uniref:Uncharacterized protein n=1 Tax=Canavalia gladiata TaxID=3824 RepID=A0AAN9JYL8_CANGL
MHPIHSRTSLVWGIKKHLKPSVGFCYHRSIRYPWPHLFTSAGDCLELQLRCIAQWWWEWVLTKGEVSRCAVFKWMGLTQMHALEEERYTVARSQPHELPHYPLSNSRIPSRSLPRNDHIALSNFLNAQSVPGPAIYQIALREFD